MTNECEASAIFYLYCLNAYLDHKFHTAHAGEGVQYQRENTLQYSILFYRHGHLPHSEHVFINVSESRC